MILRTVILSMVILQAGVAHARFGKRNSGGVVGSSSSSSSSGSSTHAAVPVDSPRSGSSGSGSSSRGAYNPDYEYRPRSWSHGFYSGAFVPLYGYGYGYYMAPSPDVVVVNGQQQPQQEPAELRVTVNAELGVFLTADRGYTLGVNGFFEGERLGVHILAQGIMVGADDGSGETDQLLQMTGKLTFAFLTGRYGRLRAEVGTDFISAPDLKVFGASLGLSGTVWLVDSLAFEASAWGTVYPFWQLDGRAGLVYGLGPVGFRVGVRAQMLDDRGLVDGQIHRDVFVGPYAGVGVVF